MFLFLQDGYNYSIGGPHHHQPDHILTCPQPHQNGMQFSSANIDSDNFVLSSEATDLFNDTPTSSSVSSNQMEGSMAHAHLKAHIAQSGFETPVDLSNSKLVNHVNGLIKVENQQHGNVTSSVTIGIPSVQSQPCGKNSA